MPLIKRLSLVSLITALLILSGWISLLMIADTQAAGAQTYLKEWQSQQRVPDEPEWQQAYGYINSALKLDPANPNYLAKLAELYRWRSLSRGNTQLENDIAKRNSLDIYRQLLKLRPSWPYYWAGLIETKFALWEFDDEMYMALQNAAHYGPWFKYNQQTILKVGYQGWMFLDGATQNVVNDTLERAIKIQPQKTIELAFNAGFPDKIMPYLEKDKGLMNQFNRELAGRIKKLQL